MAQGMGTDANAALLNAYSNAVQQALGLYVDAETLVQNDQIVRDQILTYSKGFIQEASETSKSQSNGLFQVSIRAKVKRQQLLARAKESNFSVKQVEGASLHAQVVSQVKQEKDAKALLQKALLPLTKKDFYRAELVPPTTEQPNPELDKKKSDEKSTTLIYKVYLWIDEKEYFNYINSTLIPVLEQIAVEKKEFNLDLKIVNNQLIRSYSDQNFSPSNCCYFVLTWKDKPSTKSKWKAFCLPDDVIQENKRKAPPNTSIELSLMDEKGEILALGEVIAAECLNNMTCGILYSWDRYSQEFIIGPYFNTHEHMTIPKSIYSAISVTIATEDLPLVKSAKLEVKPTR